MKFGKKITIFLIDGDPNGRMSCELSNWTGKAYRIPRIKIKESTDRKDLESTGVYLLFGRQEELKNQVYIGEAESIIKRLNQHMNQKDFWYEAIVFISKDENLNKAHIKYLENRLYEIATSANRYKIENNVTPTQSSISEPDRAEMEEFIENIKMLTNTLGHKVFDDKREVSIRRNKEIFFIQAARNADSQGEPSSDGFVVFKGSKIASTTVASFPDSLKKYRDGLLDKGIVKKKGTNFNLYPLSRTMIKRGLF
ncbi:MAG: GIY-YIG nuclease family protein [Candidatus Delongbacteria bacterium]|jgi:hypothetical protein|nr:GIY-YIG nuclease family protein [Candidatus Delongbacteria bacterium]